MILASFSEPPPHWAAQVQERPEAYNDDVRRDLASVLVVCPEYERWMTVEQDQEDAQVG